MEPDFDLTELIDARRAIEGHYSPSELCAIIEEWIDNEEFFVFVSRSIFRDIFDVTIRDEDDVEWSESQIDELYNDLWENRGEKENYLERISK